LKFPGDAISIQLKSIENFDITFIQILYSFVQMLQIQGKKVDINSQFTEEQIKLLKHTGFNKLV